MDIEVLQQPSTLEKLIEEELKPYVKKIDTDAFYAESFLRKLGEAGLLSSVNKSQKEYLLNEMHVVQETAKVCMTTAFCLWCHLAALTYVRQTKNSKLKENMLSSLENGEILAGTGLSNPMKYYAGLEKLHLSAKPTQGGYLISGVLPSVSNLGEDHWFGCIAGVKEGNDIMCFIPCNTEGLKLKEKVDYLGINGSATYACSFNDVFVPEEWVLSENAKGFVEQIRPSFVSYQIPLGLGVTQAAISSIEKVCQKQNGCNQFLKKQPEDLRAVEHEIQKKLQSLYNGDSLNFKDIARIRLETAYLTLEAVQESMLHNGSAGYIKDSAPSRRLREAYFFANLTPTVKHLEKVLNG
ncbi:alkylation response protein AidB-like acyl-CoA dehydrogenase [Neobacillus niacini]|uniref:acyl-CoA dehydrogenase family protein n=1 Tax=Neobacillus niacini TaxID=86668 RepID=UPI002784D9AF|nr:acyl-CoA dehydrogenase family protein [Neobacillus niacini]MDQ1004389.1 alkylation response protein AidB-like acyl-CoA dehydrogenase [Neobacillus niacini]